MLNLFRAAMLVALAPLALAAAGPALADSREPLKLAHGQETAEQVVAAIAASVLNEKGFHVELAEVAPADQLAMLGEGRVHAILSFRREGREEALDAALREGRVASLGGLRANDKAEPVLKLVWSNTKRLWPYAEKMLKTMILAEQEVAEISASADGGAGLDAAVSGWLDANRPRWKRWGAASTNWMKP